VVHCGKKGIKRIRHEGSEDEALFYLVKDNQLLGICILHVDDFLVAGMDDFREKLSEKPGGRFNFGKVETNKFKYTGLNIEQTEEGICVDQIEYIQSLKPIISKRVADKDDRLIDKELKDYRALTGQISWAASSTRPDLAYDVPELATKNKYATLADIKHANKVLQKAQMEDIKIKFSRLGKWSDLKIVAFTDSSYRNAENSNKSVGGRLIF